VALGQHVRGRTQVPGRAVVDVAARLPGQDLPGGEDALEVAAGPEAAEPGAAVLCDRIAGRDAEGDRALVGDQASGPRSTDGVVGRAVTKGSAHALQLPVDVHHVPAVRAGV